MNLIDSEEYLCQLECAGNSVLNNRSKVTLRFCVIINIHRFWEISICEDGQAL
ncbi:uncharacterized protein PHALS_10613 [Plasmopara halstedii]|uniref:Uncharacterized protein n=1 Tax=Plasmopara halstedii TaxID=4781 RepID=A0A0P1AHQ7_PLAHL|nr:uncharacterized protein PHALS_10613 [Plasmopara halstedii]CEG40412.1 hypothetical protein PHALS_10613 [Plasmopara halstedii]|eukprot:XP_024576781.1 hypothetical protein PHALS_10613 [Plasmopara halstedii]